MRVRSLPDGAAYQLLTDLRTHVSHSVQAEKRFGISMYTHILSWHLRADRVLEREPGDAAARSHRAYAQRKRGDHAAAVADYSAALAVAPAAVRLYNNRGLRQTVAQSMGGAPRCRSPALV